MASMYTEEMDKARKLAGALLIILGLTVLILGLFYIKRNINLATAFKKNAARSQKQLESVLALQSKDTDNDGLSDYEELYLYGTSLYLGDTDSDGFTDKNEIASNEDPNCPRGENCLNGGSLASPYSEDQQIKPTIPEEPPQELITNPLENLSAPKLRSMLKDAGFEESVLNQISDEELEKLYQESLKELQQQ